MPGLRALGVSGSPRANGNSDSAVMEALAVAQGAGYRVEFQRLADYRIKHCSGCRGCMSAGECVIRDDEFAAAFGPWRDANLIILGSPVYWYSPSGVLKDFIDRTHGWYRDGGIFSGKSAMLLSVATDGGFGPHNEAIVSWLTHYGAKVLAAVNTLACELGDLNANADAKQRVRDAVRSGLDRL